MTPQAEMFEREAPTRPRTSFPILAILIESSREGRAFGGDGRLVCRPAEIALSPTQNAGLG